MRVHVGDSDQLHDLLHYLRQCGCVAEPVSADEADVVLPRSPDERSARVELSVYVTAWRVLNDGASAEIVYEAPPRPRGPAGFLRLKA